MFVLLNMKNLKHILTVLLLFIVVMQTKAQTVSYTYKALAAEGCGVEYSVARQDTAYYIIVTVRSDRLKFLEESIMLLKTSDGEILKLYGKLLDHGTQSTGIVAGNVVLPVTKIHSTAQFRITPEQFELLNNGILKIRLSTIPIEHERTFKKDKIGKKLYQFFLKQKDKDF